MPDNKKARKKTSKDPKDIAKTLERDFPGWKATLKKGTKNQFRMEKGYQSFGVTRKAATPKTKKYATGIGTYKASLKKKK